MTELTGETPTAADDPRVRVTDPAAAWTREGFAIVACAEMVCFVRAPEARTDDELRARVNAPAHALVVRQPSTDPDFSIANWPCDVCGHERLYSQISVAKVPLAERYEELGSPGANVRYCNDRPHCTQVATTVTVWPPEQAGELCIPAQKLHATPHRGCALR
jgi:hypothetical protein